MLYLLYPLIPLFHLYQGIRSLYKNKLYMYKFGQRQAFRLVLMENNHREITAISYLNCRIELQVRFFRMANQCCENL